MRFYFLFIFTAVVGNAEIVTSPSGSWSIDVDNTNTGGLDSWEDESSNFLFDQTFFYRTDLTSNPEVLVDSTSFPTITSVTTGNRIDVQLANSELLVDLAYELFDGLNPSTTSHLLETVMITNLTESPVNLSWFEYTDFDISQYGIGSIDQAIGDLNFIQQFEDTRR